MAGPWPRAPCHDSNTIYTSCTILIHGVETGVLHSPPLSLALYSVLTKLNKNGCANLMASSRFHVASSGLQCFYCTFTYPTARFWSTLTFLSRMRNGLIWNSLLGFTWITSQFITWLGSCTYLLRKEIWKTLWSLVIVGIGSLYATGPILSRT